MEMIRNKKKLQPIVDDVANRLRDALKDSIVDFEGLYVYGSQVRGDATEDSDVDIVVLFGQRYFWMPEAYINILSDLMADYYEKVSLDILDYTREDLEKNYIFHNEVVNKGVFYEA